MTRIEKVLHELQEALRGKRYWINNHEVNSGWVPNFRLVSVEVGSINGLRALRKLKTLYKYSYDKKRFVDPSTGRGTEVILYKLSSPYPDKEAARKLKVKPKFLAKDIHLSNEERMEKCTKCGIDEGIPRGFLRHKNGVKFCECHPTYRRQ